MHRKFAKMWFHISSLNHLQFGKLQGNTGTGSDTKCDNLCRERAISFTDRRNMLRKGFGNPFPRLSPGDSKT